MPRFRGAIPTRPGHLPERESNEPIDARLVNPFMGKDAKEMQVLIDEFIGISHIPEEYHTLIHKGAWLAQDEGAFEGPRQRPDGLTLRPEEQRALRHERNHKWTQPVLLYLLIICCSLGAIVQGFDESAVNQAQIFYIDTLGVGGSISKPSVKLGLLNGAPYLCCAVLGCWLTDPMNRFLGRRGTIFVSCFICSVTCLAQAFTTNWWGMFIARFALGIGMGPKSATVPVYAAECAPKSIRGALVMMWQMWTAFGIMLGYIAGVVFGSVQGDLRWRLIIGSPMVLPLFVMAYVFVLPESPRWLIERGRHSNDPDTDKYVRAFESLVGLRGNKLLAARDLFLIYYSLQEEDRIKNENYRFLQMFTFRRNRRALRAGVTVMFFQQFCGVNVLAYYSSLIFQNAGYQPREALLGSMGFGIINFLFAIPALPLIDTFGRRNLLLVTFPIMAVFQLFTGLAFLAPASSTTRKALVTTGMYLFSAAYSPGEGPVPFTYCSECMPLYVRALAMSLFTAVLWFFNFVLAITFPPFLDTFGNIGTFGYYAAWCIVGFFTILLFVPETGNQTLEELDARFSLKSTDFAKFGLKQLVYFFYHCVCRLPMEKPRDLKISEIPLRLPAREMRRTTRSQGPRQIPMDTEVETVTTLTHERDKTV